MVWRNLFTPEIAVITDKLNWKFLLIKVKIDKDCIEEN